MLPIGKVLLAGLSIVEVIGNDEWSAREMGAKAQVGVGLYTLNRVNKHSQFCFKFNIF